MNLDSRRSDEPTHHSLNSGEPKQEMMVERSLINKFQDDDTDDDSMSELSTSEGTSTEFDDSGFFDENVVTFKAPCLIYNAGVTMVGKTSIIQDIILFHRFEPMPEKYILVFGAISESEHSKKVEEMLKIIHIAQPQLKKDDVVVASSIEEGASVLQKYMSTDVCKLFFVDDAMATKAGVDSVAMSTVGMHHQNLILIFNVQSLFVKDSRSIRENAQYMLIWGGFSREQIEMFFRSFPQEAKDTILNILSESGQADADGSDFYLKPFGLSRLRTPVIIDKHMSSGRNSIALYNGLFDNNPMFVPYISNNTGKMHHVNESKHREIFDS